MATIQALSLHNGPKPTIMALDLAVYSLNKVLLLPQLQLFTTATTTYYYY